jgi:hypothetical protein
MGVYQLTFAILIKYSDEFLLISKISLVDTALTNSLLLRPYFKVARAAKELWFFSNGTSRNFAIAWPS